MLQVASFFIILMEPTDLQAFLSI